MIWSHPALDLVEQYPELDRARDESSRAQIQREPAQEKVAKVLGRVGMQPKDSQHGVNLGSSHLSPPSVLPKCHTHRQPQRCTSERERARASASARMQISTKPLCRARARARARAHPGLTRGRGTPRRGRSPRKARASFGAWPGPGGRTRGPPRRRASSPSAASPGMGANMDSDGVADVKTTTNAKAGMSTTTMTKTGLLPSFAPPRAPTGATMV